MERGRAQSLAKLWHRKMKTRNQQLRKGDADKILEIDKEKFKINKAMELNDLPLACSSNQLKNNPRRR